MADFRIRRIVINDGNQRHGYLATATIDIDWGLHSMQIRGLRIIKRKDGDGEILVMPSRENRNGHHVEIIRPLNAKTEELFRDAIIGEYNRLRDQRILRG